MHFHELVLAGSTRLNFSLHLLYLQQYPQVHFFPAFRTTSNIVIIVIIIIFTIESINKSVSLLPLTSLQHPRYIRHHAVRSSRTLNLLLRRTSNHVLHRSKTLVQVQRRPYDACVSYRRSRPTLSESTTSTSYKVDCCEGSHCSASYRAPTSKRTTQ